MAYRTQRRARAALHGLAAIAACVAGPAFADQFKQAADGAGIECVVSARELTRFALVDDQFASVSKISTGTPYNDFAVTNEPLRGDIYVSVPETYAARSISFFATTKKGFVYKIACQVESIPAAQVFITNPSIAKNDAARWEAETPLASAVHGLGLLAALSMGASGAWLYTLAIPGGIVLELHKIVANLMWAYVVGHAGLAVLHQLTGHRMLQRMFFERPGGDARRRERTEDTP